MMRGSVSSCEDVEHGMMLRGEADVPRSPAQDSAGEARHWQSEVRRQDTPAVAEAGGVLQVQQLRQHLRRQHDLPRRSPVRPLHRLVMQP